MNKKIESLINIKNIENGFNSFFSAEPFDHCVIDNFLVGSIADKIEEEFLDFHSEKWFCYKNSIEDKKALNDWNAFPPLTYQLFNHLNSPDFVDFLSVLYGKRLYADSGLHGGGWHCHGTGGNLNPHFDYSIHPKLNLQRVLNIIIYVSSELENSHGGHLGLWSHDSESNLPDRLMREVQPIFNRAVIFDTTQNSWHGMSRALVQPHGVYRKSLAIYYLSEPEDGASQRGRALFAPRENQLGDRDVEELIQLRSSVETSSQAYLKQKNE